MIHAPSVPLPRWPRLAHTDAPLIPALAVVALLAVPAEPDAATGSTGATLADAASAVLVAHCVLRLLRDRRRPLTRTAAVLLGLPVIGITAAVFGSAGPATGLAGAVRHLQIFVLVPAALLLLLRDRRDARLVAAAVVALALAEGAVGVHQYVTGTGASYMGQDIRAVGTFGATDVMGMAAVVGYGLVCALGLALAPRSRGQRRAALLCAALLVLPLVLSFSRGAWLATAAACTAQLLLAGRRISVPALAAGTAAAVVLVVGLGVGTGLLRERVASITQVTDAPDRSVTDRYTMWVASIGMWREAPVTGVGLKGFPAYRDSHASLALSSGGDTAGAGAVFRRQPLLSPHNMYLLILSEQGLLGLTALLGSWLALLTLGLRRLSRTVRGKDCGLIACGLLIWQLVDFLYADIGGPSTVLTAIGLGLAAWWALAGTAAP
ncbi:O-antigen ligase family protein [Streptomyces sannanensis]|uniref:O-antigen ligase family protein n=1 Tax=Streptomyces sannanensis TaxID=285536 RepID=A0ABP6SBB5_9ACTN